MNRKIFVINGIVLIVIGGLMLLAMTYENPATPTTLKAVSELIICMFVLTGYVLATIGNAMPKT